MTAGTAGATVLLLLVLQAPQVQADQELMLTLGGGSQPHADQYNRSAGVDLSFYRHARSPRQHLQIGISYTRIRTDTDAHSRLWAISIYPQLTLFPSENGSFRSLFPDWAAPYFFVRALGPSYLSEKQLGERQQARHFAFQAQVGFGVQLGSRGRSRGLLSLSWKHFSNAGLDKPNDGLDIPLVLTLGWRF